MEDNQQISSFVSDQTDQLEVAMLNHEPVYCPLHHQFTNGMYSRTIYMPKGTLITSLVHRTEHQFIVSHGSALVKVNENEWDRIFAPFVGVTKPGTRRILHIEEDCVWTTLHPTDIQPTGTSREAILEAVQKVQDIIIEPHENKYLGGKMINNVLTKTINNED